MLCFLLVELCDIFDVPGQSNIIKFKPELAFMGQVCLSWHSCDKCVQVGNGIHVISVLQQLNFKQKVVFLPLLFPFWARYGIKD